MAQLIHIYINELPKIRHCEIRPISLEELAKIRHQVFLVINSVVQSSVYTELNFIYKNDNSQGTTQVILLIAKIGVGGLIEVRRKNGTSGFTG